MKLDELKQACMSCQRCPLGATRTNLVFGCGNPDADLMFVGEAPGEQEDAQGIPFVGRAGKLFDQYLGAVDIKREEVYIANMLKCRPPQNRDPLPEEQNVCIGWLRDQVRIIKPKMIVCLGRISAMRLIKPDFKITKEHGVWFQIGSFEMCALYHPSLLLRDPHKKEDMYNDMKSVREHYDNLRKTENADL